MQEKYDIRAAFDGIQAEAALKEGTMELLRANLRRHERRGGRLPVATMAACLAVFAVVVMSALFVAHRQYYTENAYIALDVNPSVGFSINRYDRVIDVYAYNPEGRKVLTGLALQHKPYDEAVGLLLDAVSRQGYLGKAELVAVSLQADAPEREAALLGSLRVGVERAVAGQPADTACEFLRVDGDVKVHAHEQGLSPAKYLAILELQTVDPTATVGECRGHSIGEIREQTRRHMGHDDADAEEDSDDLHHGGMGNGRGRHGGR